MSEKDNKDIETMSFEQALGELETIVNNLERGDSSLEDSIRIYERGELLKHRCSILLKAAENRIEAIQLSSDGTPSGTQAFDEE